ncbi:MAG: hypothetical protein V3S38_06915, partial [Acidimicrobiia bacterium]
YLGNSTSTAFVAVSDALKKEPETTHTTVGIEGELEATFELADGKLSLGTVDADGWKYKVKKDTGHRVVVKFTNTETKKVVTVSGWLNNKDEVKTRFKVNPPGKS